MHADFFFRHIAKVCQDESNKSELCIIHPRVSSALAKRITQPAEYLDAGGTTLLQSRLFPGYCVVGGDREKRRFALGGRWGCLAVYEFSNHGE